LPGEGHPLLPTNECGGEVRPPGDTGRSAARRATMDGFCFGGNGTTVLRLLTTALPLFQVSGRSLGATRCRGLALLLAAALLSRAPPLQGGPALPPVHRFRFRRPHFPAASRHRRCRPLRGPRRSIG